MKIALLTVAMLGSQATFPVSDQVPRLKVEATCKAGVGVDKAGQSYDTCMRDENDARQQLSTIGLRVRMRFATNAWVRRLLAAVTAMSICLPACKWQPGINRARSRQN